MTYQNIYDSLSDKRKQQIACMKLPGGTLFAVTGIEHDKETDLYCLTIGTMPEIMPTPIKDGNQLSLEDLIKELQ